MKADSRNGRPSTLRESSGSRPGSRQKTIASVAAACALIVLGVSPAFAVLDIADAGPTLRAGDFRMRITNAGIVGNAFFDAGLSSDPSFEFPANSGTECLNYAALWVGARDERGDVHVSGGPNLEWRPTLDAADRVREAWQGQLGTRRGVDDDGDGLVDEETLNDRDDDADGEIDEDLGLPSQQVLVADYRDDEAAAVNHLYENSERHIPIGLSVHQESYAWSLPGFDRIAGLQFEIRNVSGKTLRDLYVGLFADLDSRRRQSVTEHLDDAVEVRGYGQALPSRTYMLTVSGISVLQQPGDTIPRPLVCNRSLGGSVAVLHDGVSEATLPWSAVVPLEHTTDPLAFPQPSLSRAPRNVSFRQMVLSRSAPPERGGIPRTDEIRYALMTGDGPSSLPAGQRDDYSVLVSCGPFPVLEPGQILQFSCALVAAKDLAELRVAMANAALLQFGTELNLLADTLGRDSTEWFVGETGKNGHEVCLEAPSGTEFRLDPHCTNGLSRYGIDPPFQPEVIYRHGNCIWTNADCDWCTGVAGIDARLRWLDPGSVPPAPEFRAVPGDHKITVEWNNLSEVLLSAGVAGVAGARFGGYRIYKLLDWRRRESLLPPQDNWALWADVSVDTALGRIPFDVVRDTTVAHERILYRQKLYPVGRYRIEDSEVLNGFDYAYAVVAYATRLTNTVPSGIERLESPLAATFQDVVRPVFPPSESGPRVRVVPNPYRGSADWDRPQVFGDVFTSHLDFIGLPEGRSTIKIWTVAGDFVAQLDHDSANGGGQAPWNLISRNGQAIASGIYLFTVQSERGDARGRFVVIR